MPQEQQQAMIKRTLELQEGQAGNTPFDVIFKWALFLEPENQELQKAADAWFADLAHESVAILGTSLPLRVLRGQWAQAQEQLAHLFIQALRNIATERAKNSPVLLRLKVRLIMLRCGMP